MIESNSNLREAVFRGLKSKFSFGKISFKPYLLHSKFLMGENDLGLKQPRKTLPHLRFQFSPRNLSTLPSTFMLPGLAAQ
jgi:hypothetical protein